MYGGGCRPPLPAPCILCARAVRRGFRCVSLRGFGGPIGLPDRTVRGAGATLLPVLLVRHHPVHRRRRSLQRWSSTVVTGRPSYRPVGQARPDDSLEVSACRRPFSVLWSRRAVRCCRFPDHPAAAFVARPIPYRRALAPVRFFDASRFPVISFAREAPPYGSFAAGFVHGGVPGPRAVLATWAGRCVAPADARGVRL